MTDTTLDAPCCMEALRFHQQQEQSSCYTVAVPLLRHPLSWPGHRPAKLGLLAPQAPGNSWYPFSFLAPREQNEPQLSSALALVLSMVEMVLAAASLRTGSL